jgi:2-(1,2-epoxy-1,2-dihydrophenyl)acetyl-CoA isomerase
MLSETIEAKECFAHGVVDALYPDAELADAAERLVLRLASSASGSLASIKSLCAGLPGRDLATHLELEHRNLLRQARSPDASEGIRAFLERRPPRFS